MLLNKHTKREKHLIRVSEEYNKAWERLHKRELVELEEPYQSGWVVYVDLRDDIKNRQDAFELQQVVDLVYSSYVTRYVDIVRAIRGGKKYVRTKSRWHRARIHSPYAKLTRSSEYCIIPLSPERRSITEKEYNALPPMLKNYFFKNSFAYYYQYRHAAYSVNPAKLERYAVVYKVRPNIITHTYLLDTELETKRDELKKEHDWLISLGYVPNKWNHHYRWFDAGAARAQSRADIRHFLNGDAEDIPAINTDEFDW